MLDRWLDNLYAAGVDEVLVNTHHHALLVQDRIERRAAPPQVHLMHETDLLGSAGTILAHGNFIKDEDFFLAVNSDGLTSFSLRTLIQDHREHSPIATLVSHQSRRGSMQVGPDRTLTSYVERPERPMSDLSNSGIYAFGPAILEEIPSGRPVDIGHDLLPRLVNRARVVPIESYFRDVGTFEGYYRALLEWKEHSPR